MSKKHSKSFKTESREVKLIGEEKDIKDVQIGILDKENEMVEKAQRGDIKSFERIVFLYEGFVYNLAYNMFYNQLDAQDVTQEVFIKVYKNINSFKFNSKFKTWLYRIATNTCIDEYNKRKNRIWELDTEASIDELFPDEKEKTPEKKVLEDETAREVRTLIKALPFKYRLPVVLRDMQGLSYAEISEALKIKESDVKTRINRGRAKLREKYLKLEKRKSIERHNMKDNKKGDK